MTDVITTHRMLATTSSLVASDMEHLRELSRKLIETRQMLHRANLAILDSLRYYGTSGTTGTAPQEDWLIPFPDQSEPL
jgi:hypothetical protein